MEQLGLYMKADDDDDGEDEEGNHEPEPRRSVPPNYVGWSWMILLFFPLPVQVAFLLMQKFGPLVSNDVGECQIPVDGVRLEVW